MPVVPGREDNRDTLADGRDETEDERLDRNLDELLQELRVALPGVQVLFAFLLTVPFQQRFADVSSFQKNVYFVALLFSATASLLFIAPTAYHRITFRRRDKLRMVRTANRQTIAGLLALAVAMSAVLLLVTDFIFSRTIALIVAGGAALAFGGLWYALPFTRRLTAPGRKR